MVDCRILVAGAVLGAALGCSSTAARAQAGGNAIREEPEYQTEPNQPVPLLALTDSTFLIRAGVQQFVRADRYLAVFGVHEEAATVAQASTALAARLRSFKERLKKLGVAEGEVYTDVVAQTRVLDVRPPAAKGSSFQAEQYVSGYELNRNVVVPLRSLARLEELMTAAAAEGVFDLVKVDYIVDNPGKIYDALFEAAGKVINDKKSRYLALTGARLKPGAQVYAEQFGSQAPGQLYRRYQATSAAAPTYNLYRTDQYRVKELRPFETYYYQAPAGNFDRVINAGSAEPLVAFSLWLQVKYTLDKQRR